MITQAVYDRAQVILSKAVDNGSELTEFENDFISGLIEKFEKYGLNVFLSEKQIRIIGDIAKKLDV